MKKKLALIMTMSLLLTSVSPVNAAEVIEIAEEENLSASFSEDSEDPEIEIVEDPDTVSEADVSAEEVIPQEDGTDEEIFTEDMSLEDVSGLIEDDDAGSGMISEIYVSESMPAGDAEDGRGRADYGEFLMSAASEQEGPEYYGSQLSENQKAMYELLKTGNWELGTPDSSGEIPYTMSYSPDTDYSFELESTDYASSEVYKSIREKLFSDAYTAFDAYLYDYPEESFWIDRSGFGYAISYGQDWSTGMWHFSIINMRLNAYERWTGAKGQLTALESYIDNSVAEIQAVDGYAAMTPGEKLKAVHDHICDLVSYGNASTTIEAQHTPYGAYDSEHKVVCEGYSKLFKILVDKLEIADNVLVSGYAHTSNSSGGAHMWNAVSLEGSWYLLDATWDDQDESSTVYYDYFLAGSGSKGFSYRTIGEEHEAYASFSSSAEEFIIPTLSETMYHQRKQTGVTATCTQAGNATIVCGLHPMMGGGDEPAAETVTIPAAGHSWGAPEYVWTGDNSSVTAECVCTRDETHTESETVQTTSEITKQPGCESKGETTYTAVFTKDAFETQTKTVANIAAAGHDWRGPNWQWPTNTQARALFICRNNSTHTQSVFATATPEVIKKATCETDGQVVYTAVVEFEGNTYTGQKPVTIPRMGHHWNNPEYTWEEDYSSAAVTLTCDNDNTHTKTLTCTVTSEITQEPSYTTPGVKTYTAVVEYERRVYQDQKTEVIPVLTPSGVTDDGLSWEIADGVLTVSLTDGAQSTEIPDYTSADDAPWAEAAAELNVSKIVVEEGITKVGANSFAGMEGLDEISLPQSLEELAEDSVDAAVLSTVNVNYAGSESEWEALTQGTAFQDVNMTSTHTHVWGEWYQKTPATCTADAILERECEICHTTETMTDENTATGHSWGSPSWEWADDYTSATLKLICDNNETHIKTLAGTVTSETTQAATYVMPGVMTHTAVAEYEGEVYQDQTTEAIPELTPSGVTDDGLSWEIEEGVLTVCLTGGAQSTEIPDYASADDAPWAEAAAELNVSKIVVEEGITKVGAYAFKCAESLDEISLPQSLEELAEDSVDAAALSTVNVNYAGSESNWETLTQGTAFQDVNMTSTHVHSWDSGKVTKPATTAAAGVKTYKCSCGETKTESIPRLKIIEKITISKKPTIQKPAPAKGKITVKWKHFKHTSKKTKSIWKKIKKVQVQCATDSAFRSIVKTAIVGRGKTKATIKGLKKKTTYYVRVRYFDGKGYSAWSKVKKVKTK